MMIGPREHAHAAGREADGRAYGVVCQWRCVGASSAPGLAAQGAASPPVSLAPTTRPRWPPTRPAHPVCHCPTTRRACPAPPAPAATGAARQRLCASASCGALAPAGRTLLHRLQMLRGCKPAGGSCGADRGPAGVGGAVLHRQDGELDHYTHAGPNLGRQARPALGFAAPAWAPSAGTGGLVHARGAHARVGCSSGRPRVHTCSQVPHVRPHDGRRCCTPPSVSPLRRHALRFPLPPRPSASRTFGVKAVSLLKFVPQTGKEI